MRKLLINSLVTTLQKSLLIILIGLQAAQVFAQDPELISNNWYLQYVDFEGERFNMPGSTIGEPFYYPHIVFSSSELYAILTFNYVQSDVIYNLSSPTLTTQNPILTLGLCDSLCDLEDVYLGAFLSRNGNSENFIYTILDINGGTKTLTLTDSLGNFAVYWNQPYILNVPAFAQMNYSIYPNPTNSILSVLSKSEITKPLRVFTIEGEKVLEKAESLNFIDVSQLPSGVYFLEINSEERKYLKRFIKF